MTSKNPTIIVGHAGSGKTEFTVNYAMRLRSEGKNPVVADMDIINPYYRARELKDVFEEEGIKVISSNLANDYHVDTPALAASLRSCFEQKDQTSIIDVGGDSAGSNVLARYSRLLKDGEYNMWLAINANRPKTSTAAEAKEYMDAIESASRLKINGIINTTHLLRETTKEDIKKGNQLARELSTLTGIDVIYTVVNEDIIDQMKDEDIEGALFPIKLYLRPQWL